MNANTNANTNTNNSTNGIEIFSITRYNDMIDFHVNPSQPLLTPSEFQEVLYQTFAALSHLSELGIDSSVSEIFLKLMPTAFPPTPEKK